MGFRNRILILVIKKIPNQKARDQYLKINLFYNKAQ